MPEHADDRVLLITGASSGIGAETARAACASGWRVVLAARSEDKLEALAEELGSDRATAIRCDVTDFAELEAAVAAAGERFGRLDAVLANAGFGASRGFLEESVEHWRAMVETNVLGALTVLRPVAEAMKAGTGGSVVFIGSQSMFKPALPQAGYAASKAALLTSMYYLADELGALLPPAQ